MPRTLITPTVLNPAARDAVRAFRTSRPWRGTVSERLAKVETFHRDLCRAYDLETILKVNAVVDTVGSSMGSVFDGRTNRINLKGRLSVVTYFVMAGYARGMDERTALDFAHRVFAHFFPRSYARCRMCNGYLVRASEVPAGAASYQPPYAGTTAVA